MEKSCNNCKYVFEEPDGEHCGSCSRGYIDKFEPMTNADRIHNMTDQELAEFITIQFCHGIGKDLIAKWLQMPVEVVE